MTTIQNITLHDIAGDYPVFKTPGIVRRRNTNGIIGEDTVLELFTNPLVDPELFIAIARHTVSAEVVKAGVKGTKGIQRIQAIHAHFDLALAFLSESEKRSSQFNERVVKGVIAEVEFLRRQTIHGFLENSRNPPSVWNYYASWLFDGLSRSFNEEADKKIAEFWYQKAIEAGDSDAKNSLGVLFYIHSSGSTAIELWKDSSAHGNMYAAQNLMEILRADDSLTAEEKNDILDSVQQCRNLNPQKSSRIRTDCALGHGL